MQPQQTPPVPEPAIPPTSAQPFDVPGSISGAPDAANVPSSSSPAIADDGDLIEKEWVSKVKHLVASTSNDPYELNRQFSALKADYLEKRYGKVIKAEE